MGNFKVDDIVLRKGRKCKIVHIDDSLQPPAYTVLMLDNNIEVGTELSRLSKIYLKKKKKPKKKKVKKVYEQKGKHHRTYYC